MIEIGNIFDIKSKYKDWFLGVFVEETDFNTRGSRDFELKWSEKKKGDKHPMKDSVVPDSTCHSLTICVYGKLRYSFLQEDGNLADYFMKEKGDYVFWTPDINHEVEMMEDSLILTVRWYK